MSSSLSRLSLTQLATFREFVRHGTLAAAAGSLGYTPGAVSQHVSALERTVGARLVERSGRHLALTDAGRVLAEYADRMLGLERETVQAIASAEGRVAGPLTVGTWGSTAAALLAPVVERMAVAVPEVTVRSREVDLDEAALAVRHGDVDVAFGLDYPDAPVPRDDAISVIGLHEESFGIAVATSHDRTGGRRRSRSVDVETLAGLDWILPPPDSQYGRALRSGFRRRGFEPRVVHEVTDTAASLQLAAAGLGATVVTDLMSRLNPTVGVQRWEMADALSRQIVLITPRDVRRRRPIAAFLEVVPDVVADLLRPRPASAAPARSARPTPATPGGRPPRER
jgi:DNA-binding transcriptional LysR family regulator